MSTFVESLKRLYQKKSLTKKYIESLLSKSEITQEEYEYIIA